MSVHSASAHHPTPEVENRLSRQDVARLALSWTCGIIGFGGFLSLFWLVATVASEGHVTNGTLVRAALAVTATVCGVFGAGLSTSAQRAADRARRQNKQRDDEFEELRTIREELAADRADRARFAEMMKQFLRHEEKVGERSDKARADIAKIQEDVSELRTAVGMITHDMPAPDSLLATLRTYIDAMFAKFKEHVNEADAEGHKRGTKEGKTAGYLAGMHARPGLMNGSGLHVVHGTLED